MQYRPLSSFGCYLWLLWEGIGTQSKSELPAPLFDRLTVRGLSVTGEPLLPTLRHYPTEAAAFADLQQAAQALYTSQHRPTQYRNSF